MSQIEWKPIPGGGYFGDADFIDYRIPSYPTCEKEKALWQEVHDARVAKIAEASGYVRITQSFVVVEHADLRELLIAFGAGVGNESQQNAFKRLTIALEAKP